MAVTKNELLTPSEVAGLFRVEPKTVSRWAKEGKIWPLRTPSGRHLYRAREIRTLISASELEGIVDVTDTRPEIIDIRDQLGIRRTRTNGNSRSQ